MMITAEFNVVWFEELIIAKPTTNYEIDYDEIEMRKIDSI